MDIILNTSLFLAGLVVLIFGSSSLIQSSVKLSHIFKLTPLFIGLVIVGFGTSAPEAGTSIVAAVRGYKEIALGNIIGSCIANIGLVLGFCALFSPLTVNKNIFKRELPIMLLAVGFVYLLALDLVLSRIDGFILLSFFATFLFLAYKGAKTHSLEFSELKSLANFKFKKIFKRINSKFAVGISSILSLGLVVLGANLMVRSGVALAKIFGVSPWIIAITVFAIGTSLPELATSLAASLKKIPSISVGNIVGSNIFNILFILGIVPLIGPINITSSALRFEFPILFLFSASLFAVMRRDKITRKEGLMLFLGYLAFIFFLVKK
ncbi:MAG: calcium/sodium antiporter [Candidatus Omnitrophica bacterium]|nr:calcium/sodium antiporter [Candidatus Omnitrophota bacterium]